MTDDDKNAGKPDSKPPKSIDNDTGESIENNAGGLFDSELSNEGDNENLSSSLDDETSENAASTTADIRRDRYRRRRELKAFLDEIGVPPANALDALREIDRLIPDPLSLSPGKSLEDRIVEADKDFQLIRSSLFQASNRTMDFDAQDDIDRRFRDNASISKMIKSEHGLLRSIMVNDRVMSGYAVRLAEHEAARAFMLQELVRRRTLAESWRYSIPKFLLPLFAAFHAAGVRRNDIRSGSKLMSAIIDLLVGTTNGEATRSKIESAMQQTEDQFAALLTSEVEPFGALQDMDAGDNSPMEGASEDFKTMQTRLRMALENANTALVGLENDQDEALEAAALEIRGYQIALDMNGGMNSSGQLVFESIEDFMRHPELARKGGDDNPAADEILENSAEDSVAQAVELTEDTANKNLALASGAMPLPIGEIDNTLVSESSDANNSSAIGVDLRTDEGPQNPRVKPTESLPVNEPMAHQSSPDLTSRMRTSDADFLPSPTGIPGPAWPDEFDDLRVEIADKHRSNGFNRSKNNEHPFAGWVYCPAEPPFSNMSTRPIAQVISHDEKLKAADLSRLEMWSPSYRASIVDGRSSVLGLGHELMLPPHSSLDWYGDQLGWQDADKSKISAFGRPSDPSSIRPNGDPQMLMKMLRANVNLRLKQLSETRGDGFFEDQKRLALATEDLARWWAFILIVRHDPDMFEPVFGPGYFHGVEAPDFFLDVEEKPVFGPSHIRLSMAKVDEIEAGENADAVLASSTYHDYLRRRISSPI
ncbi:hypothetical protein [Parasphingorhabdus sp.]|uniref:hypothetical protein n=1 Tax=Parasphingorhabdus sp. TaxID=2709688 RepID=UPI0030031F92